MKYVVIIFLLIIFGSLASALRYLVKDKGNSDRTVMALTIRIALSLTLFLMLMGGYYFGILPNEKL